jgi:hypothetical protein
MVVRTEKMPEKEVSLRLDPESVYLEIPKSSKG